MSASDSALPGHRSGDAVVIHAHAKINLHLRVLAREESGYHGIETLFQRIALHDVVHVALSADRRLVCSGPAMPQAGLGHESSNIAWRAAELYMTESGVDRGFAIDIVKHIPVGGGLGGGSADAAAVLGALNTLSSAPLPQQRLIELASSLGADVPFLLTGWSRALAWSRGQRMLQLAPLPRAAVTLYAFDEGVDTGTAYRALADSRKHGTPAAEPMAWETHALDTWTQIASFAVNDFEPVVAARHAGVRAALQILRKARSPHDIVAMTGSGATCFLLRCDGNANALPHVPGARTIETTTA